MPTSDEVMGQMLLQNAKKEFPYLAKQDFGFAYTPNLQEERLLEFYAPNEPGAPESPRPTSLPLGKPGVQVFSTKVRPIDVLGDYVSHYGVQNDPRLAELYKQFASSLSPQNMQERYQYHQQNFGEKRPYQDWYQQTGLPEMFRGYTFNQWDDAKSMYTPQQLKVLDQVRQYLGIK
jgi:hypothetical protein